jgi:hypothetical protein
LNRCVFVLSNECDGKKVVVHHESRAVTTAAAAVSSINVNGKKIDGSEEKTNILFTRMFFFLIYVVPSIPSSTNSHDMNIQRLTLNRSNGHSLFLSLSSSSSPSMNYSYDRKTLSICRVEESEMKKIRRRRRRKKLTRAIYYKEEDVSSSYLINHS